MAWRDAFSSSGDVRARWYAERRWRGYVANTLLFIAVFWLLSGFMPGLREMRDLGRIVLVALLWSAMYQAFLHHYPRLREWFERRSHS
jgi:hypothetical protein